MATDLAAEVANRAVNDQIGPQGLHGVPGINVIQRTDDDRPPRARRTETRREHGQILCKPLRTQSRP